MIKLKTISLLFKQLKTNIIIIMLVFLYTMLIVSCGDTPKNKPKKPTSGKVELKQSFKRKVVEHNAEKYMLLDNSCLYCHTVGEVSEDLVAPKMIKIRDVYKNKYTNKQDFIDAMVSFTIAPTEEKAIMKEDVVTYGLMEDAGHTKEEVVEIAEFIYDYKFK